MIQLWSSIQWQQMRSYELKKILNKLDALYHSAVSILPISLWTIKRQHHFEPKMAETQSLHKIGCICLVYSVKHSKQIRHILGSNLKITHLAKGLYSWCHTCLDCEPCLIQTLLRYYKTMQLVWNHWHQPQKIISSFWLESLVDTSARSNLYRKLKVFFDPGL